MCTLGNGKGEGGWGAGGETGVRRTEVWDVMDNWRSGREVTGVRRTEVWDVMVGERWGQQAC